MNRDEIASQISLNVRSSGLDLESLQVVADPYRGWRVAVVSPGFAEMGMEQRRRVALRGLESETIQWAEFVAPAEGEWSGNLHVESEVEDLPLWAESLARNSRKQPVVFASDLDEDLKRPIIVTFYSMRGGVGRSTALAYTARILAQRKRRVLCIDMDLEAPGLATLLGVEDDLRPDRGLVPLLMEIDQGGEPDLVEHLLRVSESDELYCLPAGVPNADYARRLRLLDPEAWYREDRNPLRILLDSLPKIKIDPDVVLLDARTGITPLSAPLLFDLSDVAVIAFFPHPQTRMGTGGITRAILYAKNRRDVGGRSLTPEPRFVVGPIPESSIPEVTQRYRTRALDWITQWLSPLAELRSAGEEMIDPSEVTHIIPYREKIATSDRVLADADLQEVYSPVVDWVERFLPSENEQRRDGSLPAPKSAVLETLEFSAGTAERQAHFLDSFVSTDLVQRALSLEMPLVLGRKGTGKTAVFRKLLESDQGNGLAILAPAGLREPYSWMLRSDGFGAVDKDLGDVGAGWREFWIVYTALASFLNLRAQGVSLPLPEPPLGPLVKQLLSESPIRERPLIDALRRVVGDPRQVLLAWDWFQQIDSAVARPYFLLFDGLDTGFGDRDEERLRRTRAVEGLFSFLLEREESCRNLRFKILLREDLWRALRSQNKSHLFGRSVRLEWRSQADYTKTVLKQALRSKPFAGLAREVVRERPEDLDSWSEESVFRVWNLLAGERMKGGQTAYTRNWVWNRLADANGDHGPRGLLQLLRVAAEWELAENSRNPYDRSVIRPRALIQSLSTVSEEYLQALLEEFKELERLVEKLRILGRSPLDAMEIRDAPQIGLALEVGLLTEYEKLGEDVLRYHVPDLYRIAIGMTRRGQA